jgi:hypothetical protein
VVNYESIGSQLIHIVCRFRVPDDLSDLAFDHHIQKIEAGTRLGKFRKQPGEQLLNCCLAAKLGAGNVDYRRLRLIRHHFFHVTGTKSREMMFDCRLGVCRVVRKRRHE